VERERERGGTSVPVGVVALLHAFRLPIRLTWRTVVAIEEFHGTCVHQDWTASERIISRGRNTKPAKLYCRSWTSSEKEREREREREKKKQRERIRREKLDTSMSRVSQPVLRTSWNKKLSNSARDRHSSLDIRALEASRTEEITGS